MSLTKLALVFFFLCCLCSHAMAQREQRMASRHLSKEDLKEFLLYKSKREKSKAIGTAVAGPVLTGVGLYLYNKKPTEALAGGMGMQEKRSTARIVGMLMASLGITTTVCSIPLFISAAQLKREARFVITSQSAAYYNRTIALPGVGLQVNF